MSSTKSIHVRLPEDLHSALVYEAEASHISLNTLIVRKLAGYEENDLLEDVQQRLSRLEERVYQYQ